MSISPMLLPLYLSNMKNAFAFIFICLACGFTLDFNPQPKEMTLKYFPEFNYDINTPAFRKKSGFTKQPEMIAYLNELQASHPDVMSITYIGESQRGKKVPMVLLQKKNGQPKLKVWLQGGLHGNEMATTESVLYMLNQLLNDNSLAYLLDKLDIALVPMVNIDGYEHQDRYAANGLDMNRDQTKLIIKESVFLKQSFSDFNPHVAIDFHEYNPFRRDFVQLSSYGVASRHDVMFMTSGNLNVSEKLRKYTNEVFVDEAQKALTQKGLVYCEYFTTDHDLGELNINQGSNNARSSATSFALANTISTLVEIRGIGIGRTSFKRRIFTGYTIGLSYLKTAYNRFDEVITNLQPMLDERTIAVVKSKKLTKVMPLTFIDIKTNEEISINLKVGNATFSSPVLTRNAPVAYLIEATEAEVIKKLKILGVQVERLDADKSMQIESYVVATQQRSYEKEEGVYTQKVSTTIGKEEKVFTKGAYLVRLNQENAGLIIEVLEPEAPNSFVFNSIIKANPGQKLPIYRVLSL